MLKQRRLAAEKVARDLFAAERAIDNALTRTARLAGAVPEQRNKANVSAAIGQGAIERAIEAMTKLGAARKDIIEAHNELSLAKLHVGLGAVAIGDSVPKPPHAEAPADLRVVSAA